MREHSLHGNRETSRTSTGDAVDRLDKALRRTSSVHVRGESDDGVIPQKPPNNSGLPTDAEVVEGRPSTKGNAEQAATSRTQSRPDVSTALCRVRVERHAVTGVPSSLPCCTMSPSIDFGIASSRSNALQPQASTA